MDLSLISSEETLEDLLAEPYPEDVQFASAHDGDVLVLGAAGKMGPSLVSRIARALVQAGSRARVYAVSRFSQEAERLRLDSEGVTTIRADLLDEEAWQKLPPCPHVLFMVGSKFGTSGNEPQTWATNAYLPGRAAEKLKDCRIVAFSTGNVYPLVPVDSSGSRETDPVGPIGEYAQSCLGRERVLEYFSRRYGTPVCILRLNYAVEARYGILLDIGQRVQQGQHVDLQMGYFNVIWQGDANSAAWRALQLCQSPPKILNLTGTEKVSVREIAHQMAQEFELPVRFRGEEGTSALLSDASQCYRLLGRPRVSLEQIRELVVQWLKAGGRTLGKPTKFEVRDGRF